MLDHAVVVATRNRLDVLQASLPLFAAQSRPAARIVVVDRSDDHDAVRALCAEVAATVAIPLEVHYGEAANLPGQRNQGLRHVREAVTLFPDDDSLWFPDTAEHLMCVYDADRNGRYGAVSAVDVYAAPGDVAVEVPQRRLRFTDRSAVMAVRNRVEAALVPQPFEVYGRRRTAQLAARRGPEDPDHALVGTIGGYRMSVRTELAQRLLFDEVLGSRVGYGTHEDKDMALRVLQSGSLIAVAEGARVFHNVHPGKRAGGFAYGFFHVFNYQYICRKLYPPGRSAMADVRRYLGYKVGLYALRRSDPYDREVYQGAKAALTTFDEVADAPPHELAERYEKITARFL